MYVTVQQNCMNKKNIAIIAALILVLLLSIALWWRIFNRDAEILPRFGGNNQEATQQKEEFPVLPVDPPKLAGRVLVGPKVATKFYLARDGKRYVFPDETKTYDTWKSTLPAVTKVTQEELESYPLGGNVWYRPGTRLIRIQTDERIFAVAHGGVLRPINEGNAALIFGANWKSLLDTLQDYYFTNYTIGEPIGGPSDYSVQAEQGKSTTIEANKGIK